MVMESKVIPLVDLASPRENLMKELQRACQWGFFQVVNHGTSPELLDRVSSLTKEFFALPHEFKAGCTTAEGVSGPIHFGGGTKGDWRDVLKINLAPEAIVARDYWPAHPVNYKETLTEYVNQQEQLAFSLLSLIAESLGLDPEYIAKECIEPRLVLAINSYPPCYDPKANIGIREHSDPCTITVLLQDAVSGLQVYKNGEWLDIKPTEGALVINVGDHLQMLSNNKYSSCLHRVTVNSSKKRTSIALFLSPGLKTMVKPAAALVDDNNPAAYRELMYGDFLKDFYQNGGPNKKAVLTRFESEKGVANGKTATA